MKEYDIRRKVSAMTLILQGQTDIPLWALVDENIIYAIATHVKPEFSPKGKIIFHLMKLFRLFYLSDALIFCVGLYKAIIIWRCVRNEKKQNSLAEIKRVFVGFGAAAEEILYKRFLQKSSGMTVRINTSSHDGLRAIGCPSLIKLILLLSRLSFGHSYKIKNAISEIASHAVVYQTIAALNIGDYVFYRIFWQLAKNAGVMEVEFLAPSMPLYACLDENINTIYTQHGLLMLSILIPKINCINVINKFSENYFKNRFPGSEIFNISQRPDNIKMKENAIILLSPNIFVETRVIEMKSLIQWTIENTMKIVFRLTPGSNDAAIKILRNQYPMAIIEDSSYSFESSLKIWNPKIAVGWSSTGLAIALNYDILPVNLHEPTEVYIQGSYNTDVNTVYPLAHCALYWPRDKLLLDEVIKTESKYRKQVNLFKSYEDFSLALPGGQTAVHI